MSAVAEVVDVKFCHVHGYAHPEGEDLWGTRDLGPCLDEQWNVVALDEGEVAEVEVTEPSDEFSILAADDFAYVRMVDTLVPCKVLGVDETGVCLIKVTAKRPGWKRGQTEFISSPKVTLAPRRGNGVLRLMTDNGRLLP